MFLWRYLGKSDFIYRGNSGMEKFSISGRFCQNLRFWGFLASYFQTPLWFFLIFGSPDVFRLRKEPINSLSYVRSFVGSGPTALTVRYFFLIFLWSCVSTWLRWSPKNFRAKIFWPPKWPKMVKIWPFLAKIVIFECFWPTSSKCKYKINKYYINILYKFS